MSAEIIKVPATLEAAADETRRLLGQDEEIVNDHSLEAELEAFADLPRPA